MTSQEWGRVEDDGTVYVITPDGERSVGQVPDVSQAEALAFFTKRYDALAFEVDLLAQRIRGGALSPEEATSSVSTVRAQVVGANAVGDLAGLTAKLDGLAEVIEEQRAARKAERAARTAESKEQKEQLVAEAERLAEGNDWRNGANRLRELLDTWKALPRIDKASDDALWRRFSTARTSYTRRRRAHFAEQAEQREGARAIKQRLAAKAESLADSTDWGETARAFRDLMREWKAAGPAPRDVDEALWKRFRGAQDTFFAAREADAAKVDAEFAANAEVKDALLVEAEALDPRADLEGAKRAFRDISERWEAAGKVPRHRMRELEGRIRKVEQAIRGAEDEQWRRTDPEKSRRAEGMLSNFESAIAKARAELERAEATGDKREFKRLEAAIASQQALLDMARQASAKFS